MPYKVIYHLGETIDLKTRAENGTATLTTDALVIKGKDSLIVPFSSLESVEMFRLHGMARMIKLVTPQQTLFLTVVRFSIAGYFMMVNFFKAGELYEHLKAQSPFPFD